MRNFYQTKEQLMEELAVMRQRITELEKLETECKNAEEKLFQEKDRLDQITTSSNLGLFLLDGEARITYCNSVAEEWFGPLDRMKGKHCWKVFNINYPEKECAASKALRNGEIHRSETFMTKVSGEERFFYEIASPVRDRDGRIYQINEVVMDITELRKAEEALRQSEEAYRSFVQNLQGIAFKGNMDFTPLFFHGLVEKITGYNEEDFVNKKPGWDQIIHPDDLPGLKESFENIRLLPDYSTEREYRIIQKNGQIRWVHEKIKNICDDSGKPAYVQGIIYDITDKKSAEEALAQEKEKLEKITAFANCGLLLLDDQTSITYANRVFQEWFGSFQNYEGKKCYEVFNLKDPEKECPCLLTLRTGEVVRKENFVKLINGEYKWFYTTTFPLTDSDGNIYQISAVIVDITDRRKAEEEILLHSEILKNMAEGVCLVRTSDAMIVYANEKFEKMLGYEPGELKNKPVTEVNYEDENVDAEQVRDEIIKKLIQFGEATYEILNVKKDGTPFWCLAHTSTTTLPEYGEVWVAVHTDISEHKKAEEKIKKQNEFFNIMIESLTHPFYVIDARDYTIKLANSAAGFGKRFKGQTCYSLTHKQKKPCSGEHPCPIEKVKETKKPVMVEHIHYANDGEPRYVEVHAYPIFDRDGNVIQSIEYNLDITERKKAENALRESEEKYHGLVSSLQEGVWAIDRDDRTIFVNDRMAEMLGYSVDEMIGKKVFDFMDERGIELCKHYIERRKLNIKEQHDFELMKKNGDRIYVTMEASPTYDENGNYSGGVTGVINITERKKAEDALKKAKEEIELWNKELGDRVKEKSEELVRSQHLLFEAEKLAAMGQMAGGLAHELNSPLAGLLPMLEKFRSKAERGTEAYTELSLMLKACNHMAKIIKDFGAFSRESKGIMTALSLNEMIEDTLSFSAIRFKQKSIKVNRKYEEKLPLVKGEKTELQQVVINMITNACDALSRGGELTIKTGISKDGNNVIMEFIDNGAGIEKEYLGKIFDPFFTTKGAGKGTGLGLSVSYGIIKKHKGQISVESEPGKGTKFTISLPAIKPFKTFD